MPADPALITEANFRYAGGQAAMRELLALGERPDAVFAANDLMALGALHAAQEAGVRVPDDLLLVGYDDIPFAAISQPPLTTMAMPKRELGRAAAALLADQMPRRGAHDDVRQMLSAELVVRTSSTRAAGNGAAGGDGRAEVASLLTPRRLHSRPTL
jgi:DNA-binding LacI/PurR family transcriptional regulator